LPCDHKLSRAKVYQWMFFEQNVHEGSVAVRMAVYNYPQRDMDRSPARLEALLEAGSAALDVMEVQLQQTPFLVGDALSLADVCLYAYTHGAAKGGFDVSATTRPGIAAWLERVAQNAGHVPIGWLPPLVDEEK
jgi:glutathione S-transferase